MNAGARRAAAGGLQELMDHISAESARECGAIAAQATAAARTILQEARRQARRNVAAAAAAERAEREARAALERAGVATQLRQQRQRLEAQALAQGWQLLQPELERCWQSPALRVQWAEAALRLAAVRLLGRRWLVRHPLQWSGEEGRAASAAAAGAELHWQEDAELSCGLRIEADGAVVDASAAGLLRQRDQVQGRLLSVIEQTLAAGVRK